MPVAKETLRIGFTVVAIPGSYVTKEAVAANDWADKVDDGPDIGGSDEEVAKPKKAAKVEP